jgi:pilus assembly protein CpaE
MSMLPRLILASDDAELRVRLEAALDGLAAVAVCPPTATALLQSLVESTPALLLVDLAGGVPLAQVIPLVRRADAGLQTIAVGDTGDVAAVLGAVRAGAGDVIDRAEPASALRAQLVRHFRAEGPRVGGGFELVLAAQPGCGDSLFAVNLAAQRAAAGRELLLIDCTLPASEAGAALDLKLGYTVQDAIKDVGRMDRTLANSALARHAETGLSVLPLATAAAPDVDAVGPDALARVVGAVRPLFRDTLLTAGGVRSPGLLLEFMQAAARIYFVCPQKFTAVADGRRLLDAVAPGPEVVERMTLVVDDHHIGITLTEDQMRAALLLPRSVRLPPSRVELINGLNTGRPLVLEQPRGAYAQALSRLSGPVQDAPAAGPARLLGGALALARQSLKGAA